MPSITELFELAVRHHLSGDLRQAELHYRQVLQADPSHAHAHNNLGTVLNSLGQPTEAIDCFRLALRIDANYAAAHQNLGNALRTQGLFAEAIDSYRQALRIDSNNAELRCDLGTALMQDGKLQEAESCFRAALRHDSSQTNAWAALVSLLRGRLSEDDVAAMRRLLATVHLTEPKRATLLFGLAQALDLRKDYKEAAECLRHANALDRAGHHRRKQAYDAVAHGRFADRLLATFTPSFFGRTSGFGVDSQRPVFIFGMPRSGTTLLEQVLASHPQVFGAGEVHLAEKDFATLTDGDTHQTPTFEVFARIDSARVERQALWHLERLRELNADALRVVDKSPNSLHYLGVLALLFPKAHFIHARRDLRDVAVSCWMTRFTHLTWANDLDHIASRIREYSRMMEHWRKVLPVPMLEIDYAETVNDLEGVAPRLVSGCGLEWDPACLAFHETKRPVQTASATQVRQPIYDFSVARWRNYENELGELFAKLPQEG